jgi:DNA-directed RNA polymerase specialized sigma24 family protein
MSAGQNNSPAPRLTRAEIEAVLDGLSDADWRRAETLASSLASGVNGWEPEDLLQETLTRFLELKRSWPAGIPPLVVLGNAMHSIASNARKRARRGPIEETIEVDPLEVDDDLQSQGPSVHSKTTFTPEGIVIAKEQLEAIKASCEGDQELHNLVTAWAMDLRGQDACEELGWDEKKYDAARQRLTRRLNKLDPDRSKT